MAQAPTPQRLDAQQSAEWENEGGHLKSPPLLERLGITRVLVEIFLVGDYRYTSLADAVAQAKRMALTGGRETARLPLATQHSSQPVMA